MLNIVNILLSWCILSMIVYFMKAMSFSNSFNSHVDVEMTGLNTDTHVLV